MPDRISSLEEFVKKLDKGDVFWHMLSWHYRPHGVEGPCKIIGFVCKGRQKFVNVRYRVQHGSNQCVEEHSVNDLTNPHHGVFLREEDAQDYFKEQKKRYAQNPELLKEAKKLCGA